MSRAYLAFTAKGEALAHRLAEALPGSVSRCGGDVTLKGWTAEHFAQDEAPSMPKLAIIRQAHNIYFIFFITTIP